MKIPSFRDRGVRIAAVLTAILMTMPVTGAAQRRDIPVERHVAGTALTSVPRLLAANLVPLPVQGVQPVAFNLVEVDSAPSPSNLRLKYKLAGTVIGGLLGYTAYRVAGREDDSSCNPEDIDFCPLIPYSYVVIGAAAGTLIGTLLGRAHPTR